PRALEARFRELLELAVEVGDRGSEIRARVGLGSIAARAGDAAAAVAELEPAVASEGVSPVSHTDVYAILADAYEALGTPRRSVRLLERALADVRASKPTDTPTELRLA